MDFKLAPLPYEQNALEPVIGRETVRFHYEKHHAGYLKKLAAAIKGEPEEKHSLDEVVRTAEGSVFNNAAQVWNHDFYWQSLSPDGGGEPPTELRPMVEDAFGSADKLRESFVQTGKGHFGSGWLWLAVDRGRLRLVDTHDAANPLSEDFHALLTVDLWEHAYYLDHQNQRGAYLEGLFDKLLNWEFALRNLENVPAGKR